MAGTPIKRARRAKEEEQVQKLLADPMWRLNNLYHIKSEDTGAIAHFQPYPEQQEVFDAVINDDQSRDNIFCILFKKGSYTSTVIW